MFLFEPLKKRDDAHEVDHEVKHIGVEERVSIGSINCPPANVNFVFFPKPQSHSTLEKESTRGGKGAVETYVLRG